MLITLWMSCGCDLEKMRHTGNLWIFQMILVVTSDNALLCQLRATVALRHKATEPLEIAARLVSQ